jgi:hypothetical protein
MFKQHPHNSQPLAWVNSWLLSSQGPSDGLYIGVVASLQGVYIKHCEPGLRTKMDHQAVQKPFIVLAREYHAWLCIKGGSNANSNGEAPSKWQGLASMESFLEVDDWPLLQGSVTWEHELPANPVQHQVAGIVHLERSVSQHNKQCVSPKQQAEHCDSGC